MERLQKYTFFFQCVIGYLVFPGRCSIFEIALIRMWGELRPLSHEGESSDSACAGIFNVMLGGPGNACMMRSNLVGVNAVFSKDARFSFL